MQPGLDGLRTKTKEVCSLPDAHFLDHASDQHGPKSQGQVVNCPFQNGLYFALSHCAFGIELWGCKWKWDDLVLRRLSARHICQIDRRAAGADSAQRFIQHYARQPCREERFPTELCKI